MIVFSLSLLAFAACMVWWMQRSDRRSQENPEAADPTGSKHQKRLRRMQSVDRWAPIASGVLIAVAIAMFVMGATPDIAFYISIFGVFMAIGWRMSKTLLKVERIPDRRKRQAAEAELKWRRVNRFPWLIGAVLIVQSTAWSLPIYFGIDIPGTLSEVSVYFFTFYFVAGIMMLAAGFTGRLAPAEAYCSHCGCPCDTEAESAQCVECGGVLAENTIKQTRWVRAPRLITIGAVATFITLATMYSPIHYAVGRAIASVSATRGLVAFLHANADFHSGFDVADRIVWPELQTRMPLAPNDRDRLVEELLHRAGSEFAMLSLSTPSMGTFLQKEVGNGLHAGKHIEQALEIVKNTNIPKDSVYQIATLLKALYATPASALTPEQFSRLVCFTLSTLESQESHDSMVWVGGDTWLTEQSKSGRLTPTQEFRVLIDTHQT